MIRRRLVVTGVVQGVGFRPFIARLADHAGVGGFVANQLGQVVIEVEGRREAVSSFATRMLAELPEPATVEGVTTTDLPRQGTQRFEIVSSAETGTTAPAMPADLAVCGDCLREAKTPSERRFGYGFGSCTRCGPRFTVARAAPWDRERTTMASYALCERCESEYRDPGDRRFHAQTIACRDCGPRARLVEAASGRTVAGGGQVVTATGRALQGGDIVALKGIGGFLLLVRADSEAAVARLRQRKKRPTKPMAVMVEDLEAARGIVVVGAAEREALEGPAAPIVLCRRLESAPVAASVAPFVSHLGVMLPASPLHALIASALDVPLVATSGNLHDEPLCISNDDAAQRLAPIADYILDHDRDIVRAADDSVVDIVGGSRRVLRMSRGLAPRVVSLGVTTAEPLLATGGHLKAAPALVCDDRALLWPHVGDLDGVLARAAFTEAIADLERFAGARASRIACDAHPDYASTLWAERDGRAIVRIQHHHAHVAACLAEWGHERGLGVAWDGSGYGDEALLSGEPASEPTSWGGEFIEIDGPRARRLHHWRPFPLIGGDAAARDGRRVLAGVCSVAQIVMPGLERWQAVARLAPTSTSVGRLFDAVAALVGVCERSTFEGEAARRLEALAEPGGEPYPVELATQLDWRPMLEAMLSERDDPRRVATRFHATLVDVIVRVASARNADLVALTGGCFQNQRLIEDAMSALQRRNITVITPMSVPTNDGGLALGQAWVAARHESQAQWGRGCA